jgi:hypothetical protein
MRDSVRLDWTGFLRGAARALASSVRNGVFFGLTVGPIVFYRAGNRLAGAEEMADDDWDKAMERLDERTAKRRAKAKEQDEKAQELIREAEERRDRNTPAE